MRKKIVSVVLCSIMTAALVLTGCGKSSDSSSKSSDNTTEESSSSSSNSKYKKRLKSMYSMQWQTIREFSLDGSQK
ncbi:MAG: hypothetical protein ACLUTO_07300 [Anaerostipes sp.]